MLQLLRVPLAIERRHAYGGGVGTGTTTDGRHARRERSRAAVIDAAFELIREGDVAPSVDAVAERAGVSAASVFRYFDGIDDMRRQAFVRFRQRFLHLYEIPDERRGGPPGRVKAFVASRLALYDVVAPMLVLARARAVEHDPAAEAVAANRALLAEQVRTHFSAELAGLRPARAAELVALVDSATSPEAWEIVRRAHGLSSTRIARTWTALVTAALDTSDERGTAA